MTRMPICLICLIRIIRGYPVYQRYSQTRNNDNS
jgi:hypothetical protein